jgi:hypothetical protein
MNFLETIMLIEERKEKTLAYAHEYLITDKHRYLHLGANDWQEDTYPGGPKEVYTRGGKTFVWERADQGPGVSASDIAAFVEKVSVMKGTSDV